MCNSPTPHPPLGTAGRTCLGTMLEPATLPELLLFQAGTKPLNPNWPTPGTLSADPGPAAGRPAAGHPPLTSSRPGYNPTAALPLRLVKQTLNLEFVEMAELLLDAWPNENVSLNRATLITKQGYPHRRTCCPLVMEILQWLQCFGKLVHTRQTIDPTKQWQAKWKKCSV